MVPVAIVQVGCTTLVTGAGTTAGSVTVTGAEVAVQEGVLTSLANTVYGDPAAFTVKVFADWKAPPFRLYSIAPLAPVGVAVSVVVPALQAMVPAAAVTVSGQPAITLIDDVELLSAVLSPTIVPPAGPVQTEPAEKDNWPKMFEGPPITLPCIFNNKVRVSPTGIASEPLQIVTDAPVV